MHIEFDQEGFLVMEGFSADAPEEATGADRSVFEAPPPLSEDTWLAALTSTVDEDGGRDDVDDLLTGPGGPAGTAEGDPEPDAPASPVGDDVPGVPSAESTTGEWPADDWYDTDAIDTGTAAAVDDGGSDDVL
ncbi:hypothetical protein ACI8AA_04895 [Geodermatophilus sp. SYSU D01180]